MTEKATKENRTLIDFWGKAFAASGEEQAQDQGPKDWKALAPSEKLFQAASSLGQRKKVLDFGCGNAWAGIIAVKSGCPDVTAADAADGAVNAARYYAGQFGADPGMHIFRTDPEWLKTIPGDTYDGIFCSNVLDVVPEETAEEMIRELARVSTGNASVIIGLNYYLAPEAAAEKGLALAGGNRLYIDGVLRLVSRSDKEWERIFARFFTVERLEHFAWPGEAAETRRLFYLKHDFNHIGIHPF